MKITIINAEGKSKTFEIPKCLEESYLKHINIEESTWIVEK